MLIDAIKQQQIKIDNLTTQIDKYLKAEWRHEDGN
jgi:hypothetical protein